jgi:hypothetical protein
VLPPSYSDIVDCEEGDGEDEGEAGVTEVEGKKGKKGKKDKKGKSKDTSTKAEDKSTTRRVTLMIGWWAHEPSMSAQKDNVVSGRAFCSMPPQTGSTTWPSTMALVTPPPPPMSRADVLTFPEIPIAVVPQPWAKIPTAEPTAGSDEDDDDEEDDEDAVKRANASKLPSASDRFFFIRSVEDMNEKLVAVPKTFCEEDFDEEDDIDLFGDIMDGDY